MSNLLDTKLVLFTLIYSTYIDRDRLVFNKSQTNNIAVAYAKWLSKNKDLFGYSDVENSMIKFISSECFISWE